MRHKKKKVMREICVCAVSGNYGGLAPFLVSSGCCYNQLLPLITTFGTENQAPVPKTDTMCTVENTLKHEGIIPTSPQLSVKRRLKCQQDAYGLCFEVTIPAL